ncbi:MAG: aminopeptidase P N-terminal domain-containing protein [Terriglobales bacterium]
MRRFLLVVLLIAQAAWALDRQPNADFRARRVAFAGKTPNAGLVLLFSPPETEGPNDLFTYRQENNFFYLSGWTEPGAALLIAPAVEAKDNSPARAYTEILFLPARNPVQEKWTGPKLGPESPEAPRLTGFDQVKGLEDLRSVIYGLLADHRAAIYTDVPAARETSNSETSLQWLERTNAFPRGGRYQDVRPLVESLRTIKDAGEIERIRKATEASVAAQLAAMHAVKPGVNESEISALMQYEWGKRGCSRPAYSPIVGSGLNSTVLHYSEDSATMQAGDVVVIDAAGEYSMYASDITRTLPVSGKFTPRQREIYDIVLGAQQAAMDAFQSGKSTLKPGPYTLQKVAFDYINTHGKDSHGEPLGKYFIHGLGHYVGLYVHDANDYDVPLGPGSVFTIEPGIYIPEEKLGVRIEDMYYVDTSGKLIKLSADLPSKADEVERIMAGKSVR